MGGPDGKGPWLLRASSWRLVCRCSVGTPTSTSTASAGVPLSADPTVLKAVFSITSNFLLQLHTLSYHTLFPLTNDLYIMSNVLVWAHHPLPLTILSNFVVCLLLFTIWFTCLFQFICWSSILRNRALLLVEIFFPWIAMPSLFGLLFLGYSFLFFGWKTYTDLSVLLLKLSSLSEEIGALMEQSMSQESDLSPIILKFFWSVLFLSLTELNSFHSTKTLWVFLAYSGFCPTEVLVRCEYV